MALRAQALHRGHIFASGEKCVQIGSYGGAYRNRAYVLCTELSYGIRSRYIGPFAASLFELFARISPHSQRCGHDEAPAREAPWLGVLGLSTAVRDYTPHALDDMIGRASTMV